MKRLRIGLFPYSKNLKHPADRRRIVSWAKDRKHELVLNKTHNVDLVFISEGCDFLRISSFKGAPKVFDLIDGYLSPQNWAIDLFRGSSKALLRQHSTYPRSYRSIIKETCKNVDLVICSSIEQKSTILPYNSRTEIILDNHSEFPFQEFKESSVRKEFSLFWEGTTHTIKGLELMLNNVKSNVSRVNIVTDLRHPRFFGKYLKQNMQERIQSSLGHLNFNLDRWSIANVIDGASQSTLAVLPINMSDKLQLFKPENRLLIMFRLGLPCLTSNIYSYSRVESSINAKITCQDYGDWENSLKYFQENQDFRQYQVSQGQKYLLETHSEEILFEKWDSAIGSLT